MEVIIPKDGKEFNSTRFLRNMQRIVDRLGHRTYKISTIIDMVDISNKPIFIKALAYLNTFNWMGDATCVRTMYLRASDDYSITAMELSTTPQLAMLVVDSDAQMSRIKRWMEENNVQEMPVLQKEMKQNANHRLLIAKKGNGTYIFSSIPLTWENIYKSFVMHWEWHKEDFPTPNEDYKKLLYGFLNDNKEDVEDALDALVFANIELEKEKLEAHVKNLKFDKERALEKKENDIDHLRNYMQETVRQYEDYNRRFQDALREYDNIKRREDNIDTKSIVDFLFDNEYITTSSDGDDLVLNYRIPIMCYDEALAEDQKIYRNKRQQQILDIFIKHRETYRLWVHAEVHMNARETKVWARSNDRILNEGDYYYGHPHLNEYGCVGEHPEEIIPFMNQGNYIGAINQITSMAMDINFADAPVVNSFLSSLEAYYHEYEFWENTVTHKMMTTAQVIEEIKEKENGTVETE